MRIIDNDVFSWYNGKAQKHRGSVSKWSQRPALEMRLPSNRYKGSNPFASASERHGNSRAFFNATAKGWRNNVSLHCVPLPLVSLGTNPSLPLIKVACLKSQHKKTPQTVSFFIASCCFTARHVTTKWNRNNVTGLLHNPYSVATALLLTNPFASANEKFTKTTKIFCKYLINWNFLLYEYLCWLAFINIVYYYKFYIKSTETLKKSVRESTYEKLFQKEFIKLHNLYLCNLSFFRLYVNLFFTAKNQ